MKKLLLALLFASYGTCIVAEQALQPLSHEEYIQQLPRMDKTMKVVERWNQQLCKGTHSRESVVEKIKKYVHIRPEFAELYVDYFDTMVFRFNIVDMLLIQAAMYQAHNQTEDTQRLTMVAVLEQADVKRTLSSEKIQSLADLAMGKYTEVPGLL